MLELMVGLCSRRPATTSLSLGTVMLYDTRWKIYCFKCCAKCARPQVVLCITYTQKF